MGIGAEIGLVLLLCPLLLLSLIGTATCWGRFYTQFIGPKRVLLASLGVTLYPLYPLILVFFFMPIIGSFELKLRLVRLGYVLQVVSWLLLFMPINDQQ